ncbi:DUF456 domain-containing protein [Natrinema caseinilyticum]|uniref:DUF456 domain-containing protein n=1 Tax=Natrinema caseinilyticum TaxID=2961570 RepID=UPI0020C363E8|nr:DUF456 domain-containing protein [Natrinema caseinilyticum]
MGDRSDEVTESRDRDAPATDDLIEETDRLLSEIESGPGDASAGRSGRSETSDGGTRGSGGFGPLGGTERGSEAAAESDSSRLWLSRITSRLSPTRYFSPRMFLALVLAIGIGMLAGATVLPFAGRTIGMFGGAFVAGLVGSNRRYLETSAAGVSVGGVAAVLNHAVVAIAGSGQAVVAVGATVGLVASVAGYYFGRDLRAGLRGDS